MSIFTSPANVRRWRYISVFVAFLMVVVNIQTFGVFSANAADGDEPASSVTVPDAATLKQAAETDGGPVVNGATHRAEVHFYGNDGKRLSAAEDLPEAQREAENNAWNQVIISGDKVIQPPVPPQVTDHVFSYWALDDGSENWQSKRFDFNAPLTFDENTAEFKLYAQYIRQYTIGFVVRGKDYGATKDRIVGSYVETRVCDDQGNFAESAEGVKNLLTCTFHDYEKDIRPFLGAGKYVDGWTRSRDDYDNYVQDGEVINSHIDFYATIKQGFALTFDSRGGSEVATSYGNPQEGPKKPADPIRKGYDFGGWSTNADNPNKDELYDFSQPMHEDAVAYAIWTPAAVDVNLETYVESNKGADGQSLPMVWNAYKFRDYNAAKSCTATSGCERTNPLVIISSSESGLPAAGATDGTPQFEAAEQRAVDAAAKRQGVYQLQKSLHVPGYVTGYVTGERPENDALAPLRERCTVPESMKGYFDAKLIAPDTEEYAKDGIAPDGSTTFRCELTRKRGEFIYFINYNVFFDNKGNQTAAYPGALHAVRFYGLLDGDTKVGQSGEYPGEVLDPATKVVDGLVNDLVKPGVENRDDKPYLIDSLIAANDPNMYNYSAGQTNEANYPFYATPAAYNHENKWVTREYLDISEYNQGQLFYPRVEVGQDYLLSKNTTSFTQTGSLTPTGEVLNMEQNYRDNLARYEAEREKLLEFLKPTAANAGQPIKIDPLLGSYAIRDYYFDTTGVYPTREDHNSIEGFRPVFYPDRENVASSKDNTYAENMKDHAIATAESWDPKAPQNTDIWSYLQRYSTDEYNRSIRDALIDKQPPTKPTTLKVVPLFYKRQAYELKFYAEADPGDDYNVMVPYNYSLPEAARAQYATGDDEGELAKARGLQAYLDRFKPGVTRRSDGALFLGWSTSHDPEDLVVSVDANGESFRMPSHDSALVAIWKPLGYTLRVFCDVRNPQPCLTNEYPSGDVVRKSDFEAQELTPPAGATLSDFVSWMWRPRYVSSTDANGEPLTYRYGSWRTLPEGTSPTMNSDVDMRPLWRADLLDVRYHPGQVNDAGDPTGPQGSGTMHARYAYIRGSFPLLQDSDFTPPEGGYWFVGWTDNEKSHVYPYDLAVRHDENGFDDLGILDNRDVYAKWLTMPKVQLHYHSNYPATAGLQDHEIVTDPEIRNQVKPVAEVDSGWAQAAATKHLRFVGWSDTAHGEVKYLPNGTSTSGTPVNDTVIINDRHLNDLYAVWEEVPSTTVYLKKVGPQAGEVGDPTLDPDGDPQHQLLSGAEFTVHEDRNGAPGEALEVQPRATDMKELVDGRWVDSAQYSIDLEDGSYFIVETKAPLGYELLAQPIRIRISEGVLSLVSQGEGDTVSVYQRTLRPSADTASDGKEGYVLQISDARGVQLPLSGAPGYLVFLLVGLVGLVAGFGFRYMDKSDK